MHYYVLCFQVISVVLALLHLIKHTHFFFKLLTLLLIITFVVEVLGILLLRINKPSFLYYHFYIMICFSLIYLMYYSLIKDKLGSLISKILWVVFSVYWVLIFFDSNYFAYAQIVGSVNVGVLVFLYFKELLLSNEITDYKKLLPFWVSIGFAIFYLGSIPFFALWNYFKTDGRGLFYILHILIVLMNVFISIGLIIKLLENKKVDKNNIEIDSH